MKLPEVTIKQLLEAGVHLGHKTLRWNPKMKQFIFGSKNSIHIIDLVQTLEMVNAALIQMHKCISSGGKVLFVSTKKQASEAVANLAKETSQYYVNHRWLGGMLTNWNTISNSIKRYKKLSIDLKKEITGFTKKEVLKMGIQRDKLERSLGGISEMKKIPDLIFIIDTNAEQLAVKEAQKLKIPIVAILDTNSDPTGINHPIPGNDDARRAINLYCDLVKKTILDAQQNISPQLEQNLETSKNKEGIEAKEEKPVKKIIKKKSSEKIKTVKKISKSIFSKVKSLTSKNPK
jgi:small subunit ribosomal protein S2